MTGDCPSNNPLAHHHDQDNDQDDDQDDDDAGDDNDIDDGDTDCHVGQVAQDAGDNYG